MDFKIKNGELIKCKIREGIVEIPEGVEYIDEEKAFKKCKNISKVIIPESLNKYSFGTFNYCNNLKEISVKPGNDFLCSENGILYDKHKKTLLFFPIGRIVDEYIVEDNVESINSGAFQGSQIKKIHLKKVKNIGDYAFNHSRLDDIFLPDTLEEIGDYAFRNCQLKNIIIPENVKAIGDFVFDQTIKAIILLCKEPPVLKGLFNCMVYESVPIIVSNDKLDLYNQSKNWKRQLKNIIARDM